MGLSSPRVALAVLPLAVEDASMFTPALSVLAEFGVSGYSLAAWIGQMGAGGRGTPGARRASWGPESATTWPGYRLEAVALPVGPELSSVVA